MALSAAEALLIGRIRQGDAAAWQELIDRFQGRLLAFVDARLGSRSASEDVVQETLLGFHNSLPNFDDSRPLESYLFSIAAHKLTDYLRREGRRPTIPLASGLSSDDWEMPDRRARGASSMLRSGERRELELGAMVSALKEQIARWRQRGDWEKLQCIELIVVRGWANKEVAAALGISEQAVANYKSDFLSRLKTLIVRQQLPPDVFPELLAAADGG